MQLLWKEIDATETDLYNGAVEATITLFGAVGAFVAGLLDSKKFKRYEIWILTIFTVIEAALLLLSALTTSLYTCYAAYVLFGIIYHFMITVARYAHPLHFFEFIKLTKKSLVSHFQRVRGK